MKNNLLLTCLTLSFLCQSILLSASTNADKINFVYNNLAAAKQRAGDEGKLCMVVFGASWCQPCQWMEKNTFVNAELSGYTKENIIAVKVDVDDFDGYIYKEQYNVKLLPTILLFNAQGKLLERKEEAATAADLLAVLQLHNTSVNRIKRNGTTSSLPKANKPVVANETKPKIEPTVKVEPKKDKSNKPAKDVKPTADMMRGEGLYRLDLLRQPSKGFAIQIGVYSQYENVLREVERLKHLFEMPTIVHVDKVDGKTIYKMLIGEFDSQKKADAFLKKMKDKAVDGIVKDMAYMK